MVDVELKKYSEKLLANGFRVFQHEKGSSWLTFGKNGNVGYVEHHPFRGWSFSTVHKSNTTTGTGFQVEREIPNATIDNAYSTLVFAPNWASEKDRDSVVKYNNIDDWAKQSYLSNTELKKPSFNIKHPTYRKKPISVSTHKRNGNRVSSHRRSKPRRS